MVDYRTYVSVTASQLRANIYRLLDEVLESGEPLEIERKGHRLRIVPVQAPRKLDRLVRRDVIQGDPDDLVAMDWSDAWPGELEPR